MTDPELRQLVESNARTAQAILEAMAEARLEHEETRDHFYAGMQQMDATIQLQIRTNVWIALYNA